MTRSSGLGPTRRTVCVAGGALALAGAPSKGTAQARPVILTVMSFNVQYGGEQLSLVHTAEVIRRAGADIVGLQEIDGQLRELARLSGLPFHDDRRRILSRWPLFDSGAGYRRAAGRAPYSIVGLDPDAVHVWAMVRPGLGVALANTHLSSDPSAYEAAHLGAGLEQALAIEAAARGAEVEALAALGDVMADGTPTVLTGDFNMASPLDWAGSGPRGGLTHPYAAAWPTGRRLQRLGFRDAYREIHPEPSARPGFTWRAGSPAGPTPQRVPGLIPERIDHIHVGGAARVVDVALVGEAGAPDVDVVVDPWPSDHRAVVARLEVTPRSLPPRVAIEPRVASDHDSLLVRVHAGGEARWGVHVTPPDAPVAAALVSFAGVEAWYRDTVRLPLLDLSPGAYDVVLAGADGRPLARSRFWKIGSSPRLEAAKVRPQASVRVRWADAPGDGRDWIGLYEAHETDLQKHLVFAYTEALPEGDLEIGAEEWGGEALAPGRYRLRLFRDDTYVILASHDFVVEEGG